MIRSIVAVCLHHRKLTNMKWNNKLTITLITGCFVMLPMAAFAEDQNHDQKKQNKKDGGDKKPESREIQRSVVQFSTPSGAKNQGGHVRNEGRVHSASSGQGHVNRVSDGTVDVQQSRNASVSSQNWQPGSRRETTQRSQSQVYSNSQSYNRSNRYGGLWFAESTHRDWDRNGEHYWNNHNYRWYDGGWLIIDGGYSPYYAYTGYSNRGSVVSNVQIRLANEGYYRGAIDGDAGPGTRHAIADYQSDHDLRITGLINDPLLQSLRLD